VPLDVLTLDEAEAAILQVAADGRLLFCAGNRRGRALSEFEFMRKCHHRPVPAYRLGRASTRSTG